MSTKLTWAGKLFPITLTIFRNDRRIGFMKVPFFSNTATAEIDGKKYAFLRKGFPLISKAGADIADVSENKVIGKIKIDDGEEEDIKTMAFVKINDVVSILAAKSYWKNEWRLHNSTGLNILYDSSNSGLRGEIEANRDDAAKLLSGLYAFVAVSMIGTVVVIGGALIGILALISVFVFTNISILDLLRWIF